jgi:hypothetical protein
MSSGSTCTQSRRNTEATWQTGRHSDWPNCSSKNPVMLENPSRDGTMGRFANLTAGRNNPLPDRSIREVKATDEPAASSR